MRFEIPQLSDETPYPKAVRRAVAQKQQAVFQALRDHNERIRPLLPPDVQQLQTTDLHDGLWQKLHIDAEQKTLQLRLLCGDLIQGYFDLILDYRDIALSPLEISLLCLIAAMETSTIAAHEVDMAQGDNLPPFIHRLLWHTGIPIWWETQENGLGSFWGLEPEVELRFGGFAMQKTPRPDRIVSPTDESITVVRPSSKTADDALVRAILAERH